MSAHAHHTKTYQHNVLAKTNRHGLPLFLMVGLDGNNKSYIAVGALILNETTETFVRVLREARRLLGAKACAAVRTIVRDEDWGETSALVPESPFFHSSAAAMTSFKVRLVCAHTDLCACVCACVYKFVQVCA